MGTSQGPRKDMATMINDQTKPPEGLPEGWRKTWACADFLPDPGPGIVRNTIRALAAERKARDAAEARVRELERVIVEGHPVGCVYVDATQSPSRRAAVFGLINAERERQASLWGPGPMPQGRELAILMEEVGEVARALQGEGDLRDELVQVAAVCVRWLEAEGER